MVGYLQTDGTDRGKITATAQDDWTREAAQRLIDLGLFVVPGRWSITSRRRL